MPKTTADQIPATLPSRPDAVPVTIGGLARAAEVGVETVRYYQRRHLLAVPHTAGRVRRYPAATRWSSFLVTSWLAVIHPVKPAMPTSVTMSVTPRTAQPPFSSFELSGKMFGFLLQSSFARRHVRELLSMNARLDLWFQGHTQVMPLPGVVLMLYSD